MSAAKERQTPLCANPSVVESHLCKLPYMENLCKLRKQFLQVQIQNFYYTRNRIRRQFFRSSRCPTTLLTASSMVFPSTGSANREIVMLHSFKGVVDY